MDLATKSEPRWGAFLIGAYLFSVPAFGYSDSASLLAIPQYIAMLLVGYAIYDILGHLRISIPGEIGLYGLMGLWAAMTFFFFPGTTAEDLEGLGTLIKVVIITLACAQVLKDERDLYIALRIFVFSVLLVYVQNSSELQQLRIVGGISERDRFAGTLANANTAAIFALTVLWAAVFLLERVRFKLAKIAIYLAPMGVSALIIYYSGSKKGLVGLALLSIFVARLFYIRQKPQGWQKTFVIAASIVLILAVGYVIYTSPFFFRMEQFLSGMANPSDINRMILATEAAEVWLTNGLTFLTGVGYGQFWKYSSLGSYAHSTPLELLANNGLIGFALFAGFLIVLWRKYLRLYKRTSEHYQKSEYFAVIVFLLIYTFFMLSSVLHESRELIPILGCLAAFGQYHLRKKELGRAGSLAEGTR